MIHALNAQKKFQAVKYLFYLVNTHEML